PLLLAPAQLKRFQNKPGALTIDTRSFPEYHKDHIPGAVNVPLLYYHWTDTSSHGIREFNQQMQRVLGLAGVNRRKHVTFYEDNSGMGAARGVWLLHYFGHDKASMLDGGLKAWKRAGYKTSTDPAQPRPTEFETRPRPNLLATMKQVQESLKDNNRTLLDVRY